MNKSQREAYNKMELKDRAAFFAGGRVTVGVVSQLDDQQKVVRWYAGRVRGTYVSNKFGQWKFSTKDEARQCAEWFLENAKIQAKQLNGSY